MDIRYQERYSTLRFEIDMKDIKGDYTGCPDQIQ